MGVDMDTAKQKSAEQWYAHCPFCHKSRKPEHQNQREFWFTTATGHYQCYNCGQEGRLDTETFYRIAEHGGQLTKHMMKLKRYETELGIKVLERRRVTDGSEHSEDTGRDNTDNVGATLARARQNDNAKTVGTPAEVVGRRQAAPVHCGRVLQPVLCNLVTNDCIQS